MGGRIPHEVASVHPDKSIFLWAPPSLLPVAQVGWSVDFVSSLNDLAKEPRGLRKVWRFGGRFPRFWVLSCTKRTQVWGGKCHLSAFVLWRGCCEGLLAARMQERRGKLGLGCRLLHLKGQVVLKLPDLFVSNLMCPSVFISVLLLPASPHYVFLIPVCP